MENIWHAKFKTLFQEYETMPEKAYRKYTKTTKTTPKATNSGSSIVKLKDLKESFVPWNPMDRNSVDDNSIQMGGY